MFISYYLDINSKIIICVADRPRCHLRAPSTRAPLLLAPMSPLCCLLRHRHARAQLVSVPYNTKIYICLFFHYPISNILCSVFY
jgi:hypothetical protein